jgi:hypothetical protein
MPGGDQHAATVAKYRATTQFKKALKIIAPDPQRRTECEYNVATALWLVELAAKMSVRTPVQHMILLRRLAKRLRADIDLAAKAIPPEYQIRRGKDSWIAEELKRHLAETEQAINCNSKRVRKGSKRLSHARSVPVDEAYSLLKRYSKRPGYSREGPWITLARVLFGNEQADLFDYLKRSFPYLVATGRISARGLIVD